MNSKDESVPAHYGKISHLLFTVLWEYLRGLDATIRYLAFTIIASLLSAMVFGMTSLIQFFTSPDETIGWLNPTAFIVTAPLIIRYSLLGAGFRITPLVIGRAKGEDQGAT